MKKLMLKLAAALIIPVILWYVYIVFFPYFYMDSEYVYWHQQMDYVNKSSEYNEVLIMGDSTAKSGICTDLDHDMSIYNISLSSSSATEMYTTLKKYLEMHDKPETIIMMYHSKNLISHSEFYSRTFYFGFYSWSEMYELCKKGEELNDSYWCDDTFRIDLLKYYFKAPEFYLAAVNNSNFFGRYGKNSEKYKNLEQSRGWVSYGNFEGDYSYDYIAAADKYEVLPMQDNYIRQIIELCEDNDIRIIIEQPPIKKSSIGMIRENVIDGFEAYFMQLREDYPDAIINSSIVYYDNEYFGDMDHLNRRGAEKFTAEIFDKYFSDNYNQK